MKTKYWRLLVVGGIILALGMGGQLGNGQYQTGALTLLFWLVFAIISIGFGFKLRKLEKRGIKDTKEARKK